MNLECTQTLVLDLPYDQARKRIVAALKEHGLQVAFNFDVADGILRSSGVRLPKSSVLGVGCPYQLLEALVADGCAAVFLPLHVVLSEHGTECEVRLLAPQVLRAAGLTPAVSIPAHRTLRRIREVLISIGACSTKRAYEGRPVVEIEATEESFQEEATGV
jgi:uncharacterized protein (DUF302 family)